MRIANITYHKTLGGLEQVFLDYNQHLTKAGYHVTAIMPPDALLADKIKTARITTRHIAAKRGHWNPHTIARLRHILRQAQPDAIILHNAQPLKLVLAAADNMCPLLAVHHGGKTARLLPAPHIIYPARYMQDALAQSGYDTRRAYYVPNALNMTQPFQPRPFPPADRPLTIGALGRFAPEKGLDIFIAALKKCTRPYRAIIAGGGRTEKTLRRQAAGLPIEFIGWVQGAEKTRFFNALDILVVPSRHEPFGLVVLEGWHHSLPIIASRAQGPAALINHNQNGFLLAPNPANATDAAHALRAALENLTAAQAHQWSQAGYDTLKNHHTHTQQSPALYEAIAKAMGG